MPTIAQNIETIKDGLDDIKENLGLSQNASLANVVTKSASVVEPTGTLQITSNDTYDVTNYASAEVNVNGGGGADLSEYLSLQVFANVNGMGYGYSDYALKKLPEGLTVYPGVNSLKSAFANSHNLVTATFFDTSTITNMQNLFNNCKNLENVPIYDTSNLSTTSGKMMEGMFTNCNKLTDVSLDNILQMCINAPSGMAGRNLGVLGLTSTYYPTSRIQALPHYAAFRAANWSIGY